jgi:protein-disulfide isomerase
MSKRNSPEAKRAARERLRAERERQEKREKVRRQLVVSGSVVAILAIAAGIGVAVAGMDSGGGDDNTDWEAVRSQVDAAGDGGNGDGGQGSGGGEEYPTEVPANTDGEDGLTIRLGEENAEHTLTLNEDLRCPACAAFEQSMGQNVRQGLDDGSYQVEYVFGDLIDSDISPGTGSKNALNALGAALNVSEEAFLDYHDALYTAENHPSEATDGYADDERLIEIAQDVPELEGNQEFEDAVTNSTFAVWALQMSDKLPENYGTPTLEWDGEVIETPQTPEAFDQMIAENTQ